MEVRRGKLIKNIRNKGSGGTTFRATLPTLWVRKLGLSEEVRNIILEFDDDKIIIYKDKIEK